MTPEFDTFQIMRQLQGARQEIAKSLGLRDEACIEQAADEMDQVQAPEARDPYGRGNGHEARGRESKLSARVSAIPPE